jgi:hypothetical protein
MLRRSFLRLAPSAFVGVAVAEGPATAAEVAAPSGGPSSPGAAQFSLLAATSGVLPFALGFAFRMGDMPASQAISGTLDDIQVTVMNRWSDGSAKFALVAGRAALEADSNRVIALSPGPQRPKARHLSVADLVATGVSAGVDCGSFGAVTWSGADWAAPFQTWATGAQMSSWIYRKPVGRDPFLVAWLEVRLWAGGHVEVLPWVENGYLKVPKPTSKAATYGFTLGGRIRFSRAVDLPAQCRTVLIAGSKLAHWLDGDPAVLAMQDSLYLQATGLVPSYGAEVPADAAVVNRLPPSFVPLQQGSYSNAMGEGGYQPAIGLLPEWDVLYLTCVDRIKPLQALQRNAYSAGRFPIHRRDETTNRPLRFSAYPHLSSDSSSTNELTPAPSGTGAAVGGWDVPHHPSVGYMAYLATGRSYFLEQLQFAATENYLWQVDTYRQFSKGLFLSASGACTTRGAAWANRTLLQAACATPDRDPLRAEFVASLEANIAFNFDTYVARPNNPFGIVAPYGDAWGTPFDGVVHEALWQQDFYTAVFGYMWAANPPISAVARTHLQRFFAWKAQSVIGRLGGTARGDWLYADAAVYVGIVALEDSPDWGEGTGPWVSNWGALYEATYRHANPGIDPGLLRGAYFPDGTSYWGNLLPAICYAVDHGVPGAAAAYARMTVAANWHQLLASFNQAPVWSVRPARPSVNQSHK